MMALINKTLARKLANCNRDRPRTMHYIFFSHIFANKITGKGVFGFSLSLSVV
jgi:hypothetical protein